MHQPESVGFITYDLQPFTEDCLNRVMRVLPYPMRAYPVYYHPDQSKARIPFRETTTIPKYLSVDRAGSTPEGLSATPNWGAAWACVRESSIVVLFGLQGSTALGAAICGAALGRPLVSVNQTLPVDSEVRRVWWIRHMKQWLLNRCGWHIYQTPTTKEVLKTVYGIDEQRLFYAPFEAGAGVFDQHLKAQQGSRSETRQGWNVGDVDTVFLFVGNLHPFKGIPEILRAAAQLDGIGEFCCVFAGPEAENAGAGTKARHLDLAKALGIMDRVRFLGNLFPAALAKTYLAADVVLLPTKKDCFPKVLIEGGLAGKPLVTTRACGAADCVVQDGINGFVVPTGDVPELASAMTKLLDPRVRAEFGARSRKIVEEFCDAEGEVRGFVSAIESAVRSVKTA